MSIGPCIQSTGHTWTHAVSHVLTHFFSYYKTHNYLLILKPIIKDILAPEL